MQRTQLHPAARAAYPVLAAALFPEPRNLRDVVTPDALKREIRNWKARARYQPATVRSFPTGYGVADCPLIETTEPDGTVRVDYQGDPNYSALQIAEYVRKFCELNHLKVA